MSEPSDPAKLLLVYKAIHLGRTTRGCCEWKEQSARRVRDQAPCQGLTPEGIRQLLFEYVVDSGGEIVQVKEKRREYQEHSFYYKAVIPVAGIRQGLFVEVVLVDDDEELPSVEIVNAHEQSQ